MISPVGSTACQPEHVVARDAVLDRAHAARRWSPTLPPTLALRLAGIDRVAETGLGGLSVELGEGDARAVRRQT